MLYSKISIVLFSGLILIVTQLFFLSLLWQNANDEMLKIIEKLDASNTDKKMFLEKLQEKIDSKI